MLPLSSIIALFGVGLGPARETKTIPQTPTCPFCGTVVKRLGLVWVSSAEVGRVAEGPFPTSRALAGSPACLARLSPIPSSSSPWVLPGALLTAFWPTPPSLAGGGAGLALYVQTPDQPHSGHYVTNNHNNNKNYPSEVSQPVIKVMK